MGFAGPNFEGGAMLFWQKGKCEFDFDKNQKKSKCTLKGMK